MRAIGFLLVALLLPAVPALGNDPAAFELATMVDRVVITRAGKPVATYVFRDAKIPRPYWCDLHTPGGQRVTRHHPPIEGEDLTDHELLHPGLWLSFGDLGGADFWRLKAKTQHVEFTQPPCAERGRVVLGVRNHYLDGDRLVCAEVNETTIELRPEGYLVRWASTFESPDRSFAFGDQEEMGLGIRLHTPLSVAQGGEILNSDGLKNEKQAWGKLADWCWYGGKLGDSRVGVLMMPHRDNFRRSWFHCRDYGLVVGNPFGRNALTGGDKSSVDVPTGQRFVLGYSLMLVELPADKPFDAPSLYQKYGK